MYHYIYYIRIQVHTCTRISINSNFHSNITLMYVYYNDIPKTQIIIFFMYVARVQHCRRVHIPLHIYNYRSIALCNYECYGVQRSILNHVCNYYSSAVDGLFDVLARQLYCFVIYLYWYNFLIAFLQCKPLYIDNQSGYCCEGFMFYDLHQRVMQTYRKFG